MSDPFEQFADDCGLRLVAEPIGVAPRDVLAPLADAEQHFLVSISRPGADTPPLRLVFLTPLATAAAPRLRDILWWLSSDAWMVEQSDRSFQHWAALYGFDPDDSATGIAFGQHLRQADALSSALGASEYRQLLHLFEMMEAPETAR